MRMRTFIVPDELWNELQIACKRKTKRSGQFWSASNVIRQQIKHWLASEKCEENEQ